MSEEIQRSLGRIESKLDFIVDGHKDHSERITSLENDRNRVKGVIFGASLFSGGVGAFIAKIFPFGGH